ncbi:cytochrome P450 [Streptomyces sp. NPDC001796]|uniref:cytochrome P450 n=1 Tax=Streptomyces sp. NPDC001796 TaxID=3364609 RepID=UPI0036C4A78E
MSGSLPQTRRVWTVATAPGIFPFVGHGITLFRNPLAFLNSVSSHGDLVEIRLGPQRAWLVCHPQLVHRVLMGARTFDKGGPQYDRLRPLMGDGLVTCAHEEHRRQRKLIQPAFHPARVADHARVMGEEAESVLGAWRPGEKADVSGAMLALTTRVTSRFLLSDVLDPATVAELRDCLAALVRGLFVRTVVPLAPLFRLPSPANRRYRRAFDRLHAIVDSVIDERRRGRPRDDLLGSLLEAERGRGGAGVTGREIHDQLITLLLTGVESTAMCLGSLFALLPRHPEVERRLHAEVDEVLAQRRPPGSEELRRPVYTRGVVTETLRMYPPGWLFTRTTTKETDLAGVRLPEGTTVLYSPYVLHHDPASFPDPDRFLPERWLPGQSAAVRNRRPAALRRRQPQTRRGHLRHGGGHPGRGDGGPPLASAAAARLAIGTINRAIREFERLSEQIRPRSSPAALGYVDGMAGWIRGCYYWSRDVPRYADIAAVPVG